MRTLAIATALVIAGSPAIIRRSDRSDARYLEAGSRFPSVVSLGRLGDATLVAPQWLLTAGHVANAMRNGRGVSAVTIGGKQYAIDRIAVHPAWRELGPDDVGLIRLSRAVTGVRPLALYRGGAEHGLVATIVGHGGSGRGDSRERVEDGRARAATSKVDSVTRAWLYFSFDAPSAGTDLEGAPGPGDSGGPAIITAGGTSTVAGVSSAGFDGRDGPGSYGAVDVFTRVSTHVSWIDSVMRGADAPAARVPDAGTVTRADTGTAVVLPNTPVGKRYAAFLDAMRAGTDSAIVAFLENNFDSRELAARPARDRLPNFRRLADRLRGARVDAVTTSERLELTVRLVGPAGTTTIGLICAADAPNKILDWRRYD